MSACHWDKFHTVSVPVCGIRIQRIIVNDCVSKETSHTQGLLTEDEQKNPPTNNVALYNVATWGKKPLRIINMKEQPKCISMSQ